MGISGWQLLILLLIVVLVFGTKRLRNIGSDLGGAVRGFRKGMNDDDKEDKDDEADLGADATPSRSLGDSSSENSKSSVTESDPNKRPRDI